MHWTPQILRISSGGRSCVNAKVWVRGSAVSADFLRQASEYNVRRISGEPDFRTKRGTRNRCNNENNKKKTNISRGKCGDTHVEETDGKVESLRW